MSKHKTLGPKDISCSVVLDVYSQITFQKSYTILYFYENICKYLNYCILAHRFITVKKYHH